MTHMQSLSKWKTKLCKTGLQGWGVYVNAQGDGADVGWIVVHCAIHGMKRNRSAPHTYRLGSRSQPNHSTRCRPSRQICRPRGGSFHPSLSHSLAVSMAISVSHFFCLNHTRFPWQNTRLQKGRKKTIVSKCRSGNFRSHAMRGVHTTNQSPGLS
jgi:hypothetical protein